GERYWLFLLRESPPPTPPIGVLGIQPPNGNAYLDEADEEAMEVLTQRATRVLTDSLLQDQLLENLNAVMIDIAPIGVNRYGYIQPNATTSNSLLDNPDFTEWVHNALKNLWGGSRLGHNELANLMIVKEELNQGANMSRALQTILTRAIDSLKPPGERSLTNPDWRHYNILEM